jgi:hypothetical protein
MKMLRKDCHGSYTYIRQRRYQGKNCKKRQRSFYNNEVNLPIKVTIIYMYVFVRITHLNTRIY